jgi:hypothetical protein
MRKYYEIQGILLCLDLLDQDEGPVISAGNSKG